MASSAGGRPATALTIITINMSDTFDHEADALDALLFGEDDGLITGPRDKICVYCGQHGLNWGHTARGWRLFENGIEHQCGNKGAASLFRKLINAT